MRFAVVWRRQRIVPCGLSKRCRSTIRLFYDCFLRHDVFFGTVGAGMHAQEAHCEIYLKQKKKKKKREKENTCDDIAKTNGLCRGLFLTACAGKFPLTPCRFPRSGHNAYTGIGKQLASSPENVVRPDNAQMLPCFESIYVPWSQPHRAQWPQKEGGGPSKSCACALFGHVSDVQVYRPHSVSRRAWIIAPTGSAVDLDESRPP
jgi:hypothetical protein